MLRAHLSTVVEHAADLGLGHRGMLRRRVLLAGAARRAPRSGRDSLHRRILDRVGPEAAATVDDAVTIERVRAVGIVAVMAAHIRRPGAAGGLPMTRAVLLLRQSLGTLALTGEVVLRVDARLARLIEAQQRVSV